MSFAAVDQTYRLERHVHGRVVVSRRSVESRAGFIEIAGVQVRASDEALSCVGQEWRSCGLGDGHGSKQGRQGGVDLAFHELSESEPRTAMKESKRRVVQLRKPDRLFARSDGR